MSWPVRSLCRGVLITGATLFATSAFAQMDPADVEVVRASFQSSEPDVYDEDELIALGLDLSESEVGVDLEEEVARLEDELASSNRRQQAFARYLDALGT